MVLNNGVITLSIEIELGWGGDSVHEYLSNDRIIETEYFDRLLEKCEENDIPITFDIVGALIDPNKDPTDPVEQDSFGHSNIPEYFAQDLVERLRTSTVDHEYATHTYSHYVYENKERFLEEIEEAKRAHESIGIDTPTSFVAPRNKVPSAAVLKESNLDVVRVPVGSYPSSSMRRFFEVLLRTHPVSDLGINNGIVESYSTWETSLTAPYFLPMGQRPAHPLYRWLPLAVREKIHRRYLRSALRRTVSAQSHAHLWTHLYNMSNPVQWEIVSEFLDTLGQAKRTNQVDIKTMDKLEKRTNV